MTVGSACPRGQQLAPRDFVARGQTKPRREVLGAFPGAHVRAAFCNKLQGQRWPKPVDLRQVRAQHSVKCGPNIEGRRIVLPAFDPCRRQRSQIIVCPDSQRSNRRLQPSVARLDLCLVKVIKFQRLGKSKDMLVTVVADQRGLDRVHGGFAVDIPERGENLRITLTVDNGTDDPHACCAGDIGHDVMQLQVHLPQRLLHMLDMRGGIFCQTLSLAHVGAQGGDLRFGAETATEQTVGMQLAQPSRITNVRLRPGTFFA